MPPVPEGLSPSPRHLTPGQWMARAGWWLGLVAGFCLLLRYDVALMRWRFEVVGDPRENWVRQVLIGLRDFGQIVPFAVALVIVATYDRRRKVIVATVLVAQLLAIGSYNTGKWLVVRYRPYAAIEQVADLSSLSAAQTWVGWRPGNELEAHRSFPSGHSTSAFAFAGAIGWFYPQLRWLFWTLAVGCAASRYLEAFHWPSDCVAGAAIGYACAWLTLRTAALALPVIRPRPPREVAAGYGRSGRMQEIGSQGSAAHPRFAGRRERRGIMRAIVDEETCTGCGLCQETCPDVFELVDDVAKVKLDPVPAEHQDACREAADSCPVEAIAIEESPG